MKKIVSILMILVLTISIITGCSNNEKEEVKKMDEFKIGAAPGPVSYALAYMQENDMMEQQAIKTTMINWGTYEQLKAMVTSDQVHITGIPITNALQLYSKGVDVRLINVGVWGMLYVISSDDDLNEIQDLKGKEIAVMGKGAIHDLVFKHLLIQNGLDPDKDLNITYMDLAEASTKLAMKTIDYAVMNEPSSSIALANAKKEGVQLYRAIDLQEEWAKITGKSDAKIPQAGFVVLGKHANNKDLINEFLNKYNESTKWINDNGTEAGPIVEKHFEKMKASAVTSSLEFARLEPIDAQNSKEEVEEFFTELLKTAPPETIGGNLPDDEFYYIMD